MVLIAFEEKLLLWCRQNKRSNVANFQSFEEFVNEDESLIPSVREEIMNHSEILSKTFDGHFGEGKLETSEELVINLYTFHLNHMPVQRC